MKAKAARIHLVVAVAAAAALALALLCDDVVVLLPVARAQLIESERQVEYQKRGYTWPIPTYVPDVPGWKTLMDRRFQQIAEMDTGSYSRYQGYIQTVAASLLTPNFTEYGFGLARCPDALLHDLQQGIREGLAAGPAEEPRDDVINAPNAPWYIDRPDLTKRVSRELLPYAEAWSGIPLQPYGAYGFRLYRNESQLTMHVDRMQTHIVSFILHIDASEDAQPWPIFIEDFHGRTHEVILTPGDILFYESSKCFHGRPRRLNGSWYCSIFSHYYPAQVWEDVNHDLEAHYAVPPVWSIDPTGPRTVDRLVMVETSLKEPDCEDDWCYAKDAIRWSGPGVDGYVIDPNFVRHPFQPQVPPSSMSTTSEEL